ncbi:MAG TPA: DUF2795 domain-containing protein [Miltoncostaeaceae bacterium]|jgi:hypothetical protein|nr:DUF2795 domain-containing protein [Miltoncostaeaceae bacterium]
MDVPLAARTQAVLEGVPLPATRHDLLRHARAAGADDAVIGALAALPARRRWGSLDEVGERIAPTHGRAAARLARPGPRSGAPPGGPDYLAPSPSPGAIRPGSGDGPAS